VVALKHYYQSSKLFWTDGSRNAVVALKPFPLGVDSPGACKSRNAVVALKLAGEGGAGQESS